MSARNPIVRPELSVLPLMMPTTPVRPIPVTTSSQPNSFSFSATIPAVRWVSNRISGCSCRSRRHAVISGSISAKRFFTGMARLLVFVSARRHPAFDDLGEEAASIGDGFVVEVVFRVMAHGAVPVSKKQIGARTLVQHVGKILGRHYRLRVVGHVVCDG